jgi:hypothetical protein
MSNNGTALKNQPPSETPDLPDFLRRAGTGEFVPVDDVGLVLAEHANEIRRLGKRIIGDVIEIGCRPSDAKAHVGHGSRLSWLKREFGWTDRHALNFMRVYKLTQSRSENFSDLVVPVSGLYLLAAPHWQQLANCKRVWRIGGRGEPLVVIPLELAVEITAAPSRAKGAAS